MVRFVVTPEEGYEVEYIEITDSEGNNIEYQKTNKENEYEFIMPSSDVTITPKYRLIEVVKPNNLVNPSTGQMFFPILFLLMIVGILFYTYKDKKNLVNV